MSYHITGLEKLHRGKFKVKSAGGTISFPFHLIFKIKIRPGMGGLMKKHI